jgi:hypothetical protein
MEHAAAPSAAGAPPDTHAVVLRASPNSLAKLVASLPLAGLPYVIFYEPDGDMNSFLRVHQRKKHFSYYIFSKALCKCPKIF